MAKKQKPIVQQLRDAITAAEKAGTTRYRIAKESGVLASQLSRLMRADDKARIPRLDTAEKIAKAIGLQLNISKPNS